MGQLLKNKIVEQIQQNYIESEIDVFKEEVCDGYDPKAKEFTIVLEQISQEVYYAEPIDKQSDQMVTKDTRNNVNQTLTYPYSAIGLITVKVRDKKIRTGTGSLVGPNLVITCSHLISHQKMEEIRFYPGLNGQKGNGFIVVKCHYIFKISNNIETNFAILELQTKPGLIYGYFGIDFRGQESGDASIYGYPASIWKQNKPISANKKMYGEKGAYKKQGKTLVYWIQTSAGQSGSPIFKFQSDNFYIVGLHVEDRTPNLGIIMIPQIRIQINKWMNKISGTLNLENTDFGDTDVQVLAQQNFPLLNYLNLISNGITDKGLKYLCNGSWDNLLHIWLNKNNITDEGIQYIAQSKWPNLQGLYLSDNKISNDGLTSLLAVRWQRLREIWLNKNEKISKDRKDIIQKEIFTNTQKERIHLFF